MPAGKQTKMRNAWGYRFEWTSLHQTREELRPLMYSYDELASECLERFDKFSPSTSSLVPVKKSPGPGPESGGEPPQHRDLFRLLRLHADEDEKLQKLWLQLNTVPEWVDWDQIERGQKVFYRYAGPTVVALTFQSLLGGMGGRRVVETLARTGGFGTQVVRRRLLETFQHLLDVTKDIQSIKPGGHGWASSIRVRFLHAAVRRRIMQLVKEKPEYYSVDQFGIPVNDLDSIGTISSFSSSLVWISLPRQGIFLRERERADYIALWRWVAHVLGTPTAPFASPERARAVMESLLASEIEPTETSQSLANNIIAGLQGQPPTHASAEFLRAETWWLNRGELCRALAVPHPPLWHTALVLGQCVFFMVLCYTSRSVPSWDEARIEKARRILHKLASTQLDNSEVYHEFKYIPNFAHTPAEPGQGTRSGYVPVRGGVEWRNLKILLLSLLVLSAAVWLACKGVSGLVQSA